MDEASPLRGQIRFGDLILDLSSAEIEREGVRRRLPDQAFEVLELLTQRPGALVTREELIARLWSQTTFIDTDAGLNTAVKKLRAALGDDAEHPRYVETVPRRGYRLIVSVQLATHPTSEAPPRAAPGPMPAAEPNVEVATNAPRTRRVLFGALVAAAGILVVAWFTAVRLGTRTPQAHDLAVPPIGNVAVLPFLNLTGDPQRDHLALGFAESVLHELAQLRGINVIAHTSSFALHRDAGDIREIGRRLNARYVLEGSLQASAARLRITTQLVDATSGTHLWSKSFDRPAEDLFAIQDEVAREVANSLRLGVSESDWAPLRSSGTHNLDAWLAFQQGRELAATRRNADLDAAVASLEGAVKLDPQFARAYVELAEAYLLRYQYSAPGKPPAALRERRRAADDSVAAVSRALAIDPKLGDALIVRGHAEYVVEELDRAEANYRAGLALSPNSARGHELLGELLIERFRDEDGLAMIARARLLDPLEPREPYYQGIVALLRGNLSAAERLFLDALELRADYAPALGRLALVNWVRGEFANAVKYAQRAAHADPRSGWIRDALLHSYEEIGEIETARHLLPPEWTDRPAASTLRFFDGDYRSAAALVYAEPDFANPCDWSVSAYALLEHARATKEYVRAERFLTQHASRIYPAPAITLQAEPPVVPPGTEHAAMVLAQLLGLSGDHVHEQRLLNTTLAQLDRAVLPRSGACANVNRTRARVLALLGRNGEAIDSLERALTHDNAWYYGWYLFDRDPAYVPLHGDPKFQVLRAAYRGHIDAEQKKLAELRLAGLVAPRP